MYLDLYIYLLGAVVDARPFLDILIPGKPNLITAAPSKDIIIFSLCSAICMYWKDQYDGV